MTATEVVDTLRRQWRNDRLPILFYILAFVLMSYPLVFRMSDSLPMNNVDTHSALWQNWWMREALVAGDNVLFSDLLFHPEGLDLTLQPRRWTTFPLWTVLYSAFGDPFAFNLTAVLGILFKAYGMYLFGMRLFDSRIPAWVCGGFYAFSSPALALSLQQPNTGATEWIPWFMLALCYGLSRIGLAARGQRQAPVMIIAALLFALNAYANLKIAIFALLLGGSYIVLHAFSSRLWQRREFWRSMLVFSVAAICFVAPIVFTTLGSDHLDRAVATEVGDAVTHSVDLLSFVKSQHDRPLLYMQSIAQLGGERLSTLFVAQHLSNVGVVSLAFALAGAIYAARRDRSVFVWLFIAIGFWMLSLGVIIYVNGKQIDFLYWTPYRLLQDVLLLRILRIPYRMTLIFVFALSVLIGYGLHYRLLTINQSRLQSMLMIISIVLLFFCTSIFPIPLREAPRPKYLSALKGLTDGAIIDVPMGRQPSKYYMSVQRFHQRPIVEGMIARTPDDVYDYVRSNTVLSVLHVDLNSELRADVTHDDWLRALRELEEDGFRFLVFHKQVPLAYSKQEPFPQWLDERLIMPEPVYEDDDVAIYEIAAWEGPFPASRQGFSYTALPDAGDFDLHVGNSIRLRGWSLLDDVEAQPCQTVGIETWWQLVTKDDTPYSLMLVLASENADRQLSAIDKVPADTFTTEWKKDIFYRDRAAIDIPCDLEPGQFPLLLGMKKSMTGELLEISHPNGNDIGSLYYLTTLRVEHK